MRGTDPADRDVDWFCTKDADDPLKDKKAYFRGYRKANTDGCILFIHAISESYDLLIVDIKDDIPALIAIDDSEIENVNSITYPILEYLIKIR